MIKRRWHDLPAVYLPMINGKFICMVPKPSGGYEVEQPAGRVQTIADFDFASAEASLLEQYVLARAKQDQDGADYS